MVLITTVHLDGVLSDDRVGGLKLKGDMLDQCELLASEVSKFAELTDGLLESQSAFGSPR